MTKTALLINTKSRRGRDMLKNLSRVLEDEGIEVTDTFEINKKNDIDTVLRKIRRYNPQLLIACGGDGTINRTIEYLQDIKMRLAIIPAGTTNNLARSLNLPLDVRGSVAVIKKNHARAIDIGIMNGAVVSNVMGVGVSAYIAKNVTSSLKKYFGRLAYGITGIGQLFRHRAFEAKIYDVDKEFEAHVRSHQLIIANGRFHAGKEIITTNSLDNGQLVIFALGGKSRLSMMYQMIRYYASSRHDYAQPSYYIGRNVIIELDRYQQVEVDGEVSKKKVIKINAQTAKTTLKVHYA